MRLTQIALIGSLAACGDNSLTFQFENEDPEVAVQWPTPDAELPANTSLTVVALVSDLETESEDLTVTWTSSLDGPLADGEWAVVGDEVSLTLPGGVSAGEHTLTVGVADEDGGTATASVDMTAVPNQPPAVQFLAPTAPDTVVVRTDEQYRLELTVSDDSDSPGDLTAEWSGSLADAASLPTTFNADGTMGVILPTLDAGAYVASISVRDRFGAEGFTQTTLMVIVDNDQDGVAAEDDCDDEDPTSYPGAVDICDGIDNDCDGTPDNNPPLWYVDADNDLFGDGPAVSACEAPDGHVGENGDCNDANDQQFPGADELCNGEDDDCDDLIDNNAIDAVAYYPDDDNDGYGDTEEPVLACEAPTGAYTSQDGDCDDGNGAVNADADELCDGIDNDCDDRIDEEPPSWYEDLDDDGYGVTSSEIVQCDSPGATYVAQPNDCDDSAPSVNPAAEEVCNDIDDDCNGQVDDSSTEGIDWYADLDGDGFGDPESVVTACVQPDNTAERAFDCDDSDPTKNPTAEELCNGEDDDCDNNIEDALWVGEDHAYATPTAAITDAFSGDMICVDEGTYTDWIDFNGKNLRVLGVDRDTVIMRSTKGPRFDSGENSTSLLANMTFDPRDPESGDPTSVSCGSVPCALYIANSSPVLRNLRIAGYGASARGSAYPTYVINSGAQFEDLHFQDFAVNANDINSRLAIGVLYMINWGGSADGLLIEDVVMGSGRSHTYGSGIHLSNSTAHLSNVTVRNTTGASLNGMYGAIYVDGGTPSFDRLTLLGNTFPGGRGGGLFIMNNGIVDVNGGRFLDNTVSGSYTFGGAVGIVSGELTLTNVDIVGNAVSGTRSTTCGGGAIGYDGTAPASVTLVNTSIADNTSNCAAETPGGVLYAGPQSTATPSFSVSMDYTNVFNNGPTNYTGPMTLTEGSGNLAVDPRYNNVLFQDSYQWDLGLLSSSPLNNTGDPAIDNPDGSRSNIGSTGGLWGDWPTE